MRDRGTPKSSEREQLERAIAKRIWKLFPRKVRRTFSEMIYLADDFDPRRPAIFISKFQSLLQEAQRLTQDPALPLSSKQMWGLRKMLLLLRRYPVGEELRGFGQQLTRMAKQEAMRNPRASLLLKLISKADQNVPLVSMMFLRDAMQSLERLRAQLEPADLLVSLESTKGEDRARALVRAYRETTEWLYDPYLRVLWGLANFAFNEAKVEPAKFGQLVVQLSQRLQAYPGLVDSEAGWRRNAAAHRHWEYDSKGDLLIMWDNKVPRSSIPVTDLISRLGDMYQMSGPTIERVAQLYLLRDVFCKTGLLDALCDSIPAFFSLEQERIDAAGKYISERAEAAFAPLKQLLEANGYV
jgi:hypothetical protein